MKVEHQELNLENTPDRLPSMLSDMNEQELDELLLIWLDRRDRVQNGIRDIPISSNASSGDNPLNLASYYPEMGRAVAKEFVQHIKQPLAQTTITIYQELESGSMKPVFPYPGDNKKIRDINNAVDSKSQAILASSLAKFYGEYESISWQWIESVYEILKPKSSIPNEKFIPQLKSLLISEGRVKSIHTTLLYAISEFGTFLSFVMGIRQAWSYHKAVEHFGPEPSSCPFSAPDLPTVKNKFKRPTTNGVVSCPAAGEMMFYMRLLKRLMVEPEQWALLGAEGAQDRLIQASSMPGKIDERVNHFFNGE